MLPAAACSLLMLPDSCSLFMLVTPVYGTPSCLLLSAPSPAYPIFQVYFENTPIPVENVLSKPGDGFKVIILVL